MAIANRRIEICKKEMQVCVLGTISAHGHQLCKLYCFSWCW